MSNELAFSSILKVLRTSARLRRASSALSSSARAEMVALIVMFVAAGSIFTSTPPVPPSGLMPSFWMVMGSPFQTLVETLGAMV